MSNPPKRFFKRLISKGSPGGEWSYFTRGGFWLFVGYGAQVVLGVTLAYALANLLPKQTYGTYQFVLSMAAIVGVFTLTGMGAAIARSAAQGESAALRYGVRKQFRWSGFVVAASSIIAAYYYLHGNATLAVALILLGVFQPFILGFGLFRPYLYGAQQFRKSIFVDLFQRAVPFIAIMGTVYFTRSVLALLTAYFISQAVSVACGYFYVVRSHRLPIGRLPEMYAYSKHLSVMESLTEAAAVADKVLVWSFLGAPALAAYALAQLPVIHIQNILGFGRTLAFPRFAELPYDEARAMVIRTIRVLTLFALIIVGLYVLAAPFLFKILFPAYPEAIAYSQILAFSALSIPRSLISEAFRAHGFTRELYKINIVTPLARVTFLVIGLYSYGIWGAIVGILCAEAFAAVYQWQLFKRHG